MTIRLLLLALLFFAAARLAPAQVSYLGNVTLPSNHEDILVQATAQIDTTNPGYSSSNSDPIWLVTEHTFYSSSNEGASFQLTDFTSTLPLGEGTEAVVYNRQNNLDGTSNSPGFLLSGGRDSFYVFDLSTRAVDPPINNANLEPTQGLPMAVGENLILSASPTQVSGAPYTATVASAGSVSNTNFPPIITGLSNVTGLSFAPGPQGLLYVLDWGTQKIDAFSLTTTGGVTSSSLELSFNLPAGLQNDTDGKLGFTVDGFDHILIADGNGGGIELDSQGNVLATFDPPAGDVLGINANAPSQSDPGDASYITYNSAGDIFVENGINGMHEYLDLSAAPEPSTWALLLFGFSVFGFSGYRKHRQNRTLREDAYRAYAPVCPT